MANVRPAQPSDVTVEYENFDLPSVYVEGAQGMVTSQRALHISFYSERMKSRTELRGKAERKGSAAQGVETYEVKVEDPFFSSEGEVRIVRRIEASMFVTASTLRNLIPWLQKKLEEMQ